jgi:diadenylate cyclase
VLDAIRDFLGTYLRGGWTALLDIVLVAIVIYWIFILIRGTRAVRIVIGLSILYLVYLVAEAANLQLLSTLLQTGAVVGLFAIVVVFQPELRRALEQIGRFGSFNRFFVSSDMAAADRVTREISRAARLLAGSRHGALIVVERETGLHDLAEAGISLHADLRAELLATIFYHGTALHDGAVIVSGDRIVAAGVLLPLSQNVLDSERYGTRHRAAIGISEQSDAVVVVVSEETGSISLVQRGRIERNLTEEQLRRRIFNLIHPQAPRQRMPLLRRSLEGRWRLSPDAEPEPPIDPDARIVTSASPPDPAAQVAPAERRR